MTHRTIGRLALLLGLAAGFLGFVFLGSAAAVNVPVPGVPGINVPIPIGPHTGPPGLTVPLPGNSIKIPNPITGALDQICDTKSAPDPQPPPTDTITHYNPANPGPFNTYGNAGLRWTVYDQHCLATTRFDTSAGSALNELDNSVDTLVNGVQAMALDPKTTSPFDPIITNAVRGLKHTFFDSWLTGAAAILGVMVIAAGLLGRLNSAMLHVGNAIAVVIAVTFIAAQPAFITHTASQATSGVAQRAGTGLLTLLPGAPTRALPADARYTEAYYAISYQAWLDGEFCSDVDAATRYGSRLRNDQAYSVPEMQAVSALHGSARSAKAAALETAKKADWQKLAVEMKRSNPIGYSCFSGPGSSRLGAGLAHGAVSLFAGFFILAAAVTILVLKDVLAFTLLLGMALGAWAVFSHRVTTTWLRMAALGAVGQALTALVASVLLFGYFAILQDTEQAWWRSMVACIALGFAMFIMRGHLRTLFAAFVTGEVVARALHRSSRHVYRTARSTSSGKGTVTAALFGATAGRHRDGGDSRRPDTPPVTPPTVPAQTPPTPAPTPATQPVPVTVNGASMNTTPTSPPAWTDEHGQSHVGGLTETDYDSGRVLSTRLMDSWRAPSVQPPEVGTSVPPEVPTGDRRRPDVT